MHLPDMIPHTGPIPATGVPPVPPHRFFLAVCCRIAQVRCQSLVLSYVPRGSFFLAVVVSRGYDPSQHPSTPGAGVRSTFSRSGKTPAEDHTIMTRTIKTMLAVILTVGLGWSLSPGNTQPDKDFKADDAIETLEVKLDIGPGED